MPDEFTAFCEAEHPPLVRALTLWCGDREVAKEVVQEAFEPAAIATGTEFAGWSSRLPGFDVWR